MSTRAGSVGKRNAAKTVASTKPAPWTRWRSHSRPARAIRFMETYCRPPKGKGAGKPMKLGQFQKDWLEEALASGVRAAVMAFPRGNGKSTFSAGIATWAVFDEDPESGAPQVPVMATKITQAIRSVYAVSASMIATEPELASRAILYSGLANPRIVVPHNGGEMFPISNDVDGIQGLDPSLAICDEIGFQPIESWNGLLQASGKRARSLIMGLGTPGLDRENALYHLRERVHEGAVIPGFRFREYAADAGCAIDDRDQWRKANPALVEGFLQEDALELDLGTSPEAHFRIFRLGQWVDGVESWLGADGRAVWQGLTDRYDFEVGGATWIGVDVGLKRDSTAVVAVQKRPDGRLHAKYRLWLPTADEPVDVTDVMQHLRELCDRYRVGAISFDPRFMDVPAKYLYDEGLPMVEVPQSPERMTPIIGDLYELIRTKQVSHDGEKPLETQVLNAVPRFTERGFTLQKNKSRGRIDACIALALAVDRARHIEKPRPAAVVL